MNTADISQVSWQPLIMTTRRTHHSDSLAGGPPPPPGLALLVLDLALLLAEEVLPLQQVLPLHLQPHRPGRVRDEAADRLREQQHRVLEEEGMTFGCITLLANCRSCEAAA